MRAILKYGIINFTIVILEFTDPKEAVVAEQTWLDTWQPEYNVLTKAGNNLGYVHTKEDKLKIMEAMTGKSRSQSVQSRISQRQTGSGNIFYGITHSDETKALLRAAALGRKRLHKPGFTVSVLDTTTNITTSYASLRKTAEALACTRTTLLKHNGLLFRSRYMINIISHL
jgi:group I intron endonuclease